MGFSEQERDILQELAAKYKVPVEEIEARFNEAQARALVERYAEIKRIKPGVRLFSPEATYKRAVNKFLRWQLTGRIPLQAQKIRLMKSLGKASKKLISTQREWEARVNKMAEKDSEWEARVRIRKMAKKQPGFRR